MSSFVLEPCLISTIPYNIDDVDNASLNHYFTLGGPPPYSQKQELPVVQGVSY